MLQSELYRIQFKAKMYQGVSETRLFMFVIVVPGTVCTLCVAVPCINLSVIITNMTLWS
jgi:hypothetical protein